MKEHVQPLVIPFQGAEALRRNPEWQVLKGVEHRMPNQFGKLEVKREPIIRAVQEHVIFQQ